MKEVIQKRDRKNRGKMEMDDTGERKKNQKIREEEKGTMKNKGQ